MVITDTVFIISLVTSIALIWRALLLEHPRLLEFVENLPLIGGSLRCGFCSAVWCTLIVVTVHDPLAVLHPSLFPVLRIFLDWLALVPGVLLLRNIISTFMEGTGVLTHIHRGI